MEFVFLFLTGSAFRYYRILGPSETQADPLVGVQRVTDLGVVIVHPVGAGIQVRPIFAVVAALYRAKDFPGGRSEGRVRAQELALRLHVPVTAGGDDAARDALLRVQGGGATHQSTGGPRVVPPELTVSQVESEGIAVGEGLAQRLTGSRTAHVKILDEQAIVNLAIGDGEVLTGILSSSASKPSQD